MLTNMLKKFKNLVQKFIKVMQTIIVTSVLFLLYLIGFALSGMVILLFNPKFFSAPRAKPSYWIDAQGYDPDMQEAVRQT
jgi:hypothetical protein